MFILGKSYIGSFESPEVTYKNKILDKMVNNLQPYYSLPVVLPPPRADNPRTHNSSDHSYAVAIPWDRAEAKVP